MIKSIVPLPSVVKPPQQISHWPVTSTTAGTSHEPSFVSWIIEKAFGSRANSLSLELADCLPRRFDEVLKPMRHVPGMRLFSRRGSPYLACKEFIATYRQRFRWAGFPQQAARRKNAGAMQVVASFCIKITFQFLCSEQMFVYSPRTSADTTYHYMGRDPFFVWNKTSSQIRGRAIHHYELTNIVHNYQDYIII